MPRSNNMGRAFEFVLCNQIINTFPNITLTPRAESEQQRDIAHFNELDAQSRQDYSRSAQLICSQWLSQKVSPELSYTLDRLPDQAGVAGDVTDIRLHASRDQINISLKHNHDALKHPRLTRLPTWLCMRSDAHYTQVHDGIWDRFFAAAKRLVPDAALFRDLVCVDENFVDDQLYDPFCSFIAEYLSENAVTVESIQHMFSFLVGTHNFYKVIDWRDRITIQDFINIPKPTAVKIRQTAKSYIQMQFDNGVVLSMRLHTASKKLSRSVKFDVRGSFDEMQAVVIHK